MTIKIKQVTDLENFEHIHFAFTVRKNALQIDPDLIKGVTLDLRTKFDREEYYLMGLTHVLTSQYGGHLGSALFEPLIESIAEEERAFGCDGIGEKLAQEIRQDLEDLILERCSLSDESWTGHLATKAESSGNAQAQNEVTA